MPKVKTNRGARKRFQVTGTGKIKRKHAFKSHCLAKHKKSTKQKRNLTQTGLVHAADRRKVRQMLTI